MEIRYRPPLNDVDECSWLEKNMTTCLKEKSLKDELPTRKCKVENLVWFFLECPIKAEKYEDPAFVRQAYIQQKLNELAPQQTKPRQKK